MASQSWGNLLNAGPPWQTTLGTALTSSASTATISPQAAGSTAQDFILPTQYNGTQFYPGMTLKVEAAGTLNAGATTSNLAMYLAAGPSGTLAATPGLGTTGAMNLGTTITTATEWSLTAFIRVLAISISASTLSCEGLITLPNLAGSNATTLGTANATVMAIPYTATAYNTYTAASALGLRASLSAAYGSVVCNTFLIWQTC